MEASLFWLYLLLAPFAGPFVTSVICYFFFMEGRARAWPVPIGAGVGVLAWAVYPYIGISSPLLGLAGAGVVFLACLLLRISNVGVGRASTVHPAMRRTTAGGRGLYPKWFSAQWRCVMWQSNTERQSLQRILNAWDRLRSAELRACQQGLLSIGAPSLTSARPIPVRLSAPDTAHWRHQTNQPYPPQP